MGNSCDRDGVCREKDIVPVQITKSHVKRDASRSARSKHSSQNLSIAQND
jgi:hypothetical protein